MDAHECIATKLDVREYLDRSVSADVILRVLEAGRLTGSGVNKQHWHFVLVRGRDRMKKLADVSRTGKWVSGANFAVIILTDPRLSYHKLDAGRVIQDMQLAAWNDGVVSCIFTGYHDEELRKEFAVPADLDVSVVAGFGHPSRRITGKRKRRLPLEEIASIDRFGSPFGASTIE